MRSLSEIQDLLDELESRPADDLEGQDLDFKEWDGSSIKGAARTVVDWAICMADSGGGTVVFGVVDRRVGRRPMRTTLDVRIGSRINRNSMRAPMRAMGPRLLHPVLTEGLGWPERDRPTTGRPR